MYLKSCQILKVCPLFNATMHPTQKKLKKISHPMLVNTSFAQRMDIFCKQEIQSICAISLNSMQNFWDSRVVTFWCLSGICVKLQELLCRTGKVKQKGLQLLVLRGGGVQTHSSSKHFCLLHCTMMQPDYCLPTNFFFVKLWYGAPFRAKAFDSVVLGQGERWLKCCVG